MEEEHKCTYKIFTQVTNNKHHLHDYQLYKKTLHHGISEQLEKW